MTTNVRVRTVHRLCELNPGICLTTEGKARKNLSQGSQRMLFPITNTTTQFTISTKHTPSLLILSFKLWLEVLRGPFTARLSSKNLSAFLIFPQRSACSTHLHKPAFFTVIIFCEKYEISKLFGTKFCCRWSVVWDQKTDMFGGRVGKFTSGWINSKFSRIRAKWILTYIRYMGALGRGLRATMWTSDLKTVSPRE